MHSQWMSRDGMSSRVSCLLRPAEGLDVVDRIAHVPVFLPDSNLRAFNELASFIGDDRASKSRAKWNKPLKAVVITGSGVL